MGVVLIQVLAEGGDEKVIGYFSRKFKDVETRYPTYDRELLAIKEAIIHFRYYLHGQPFMVYTDHASIQHILRQRKLSTHQMGMLDTLQHFEYDIKYWPGARNAVADALSRRPDYNDNETSASQTEETGVLILADTVVTGEEWI